MLEKLLLSFLILGGVMGSDGGKSAGLKSYVDPEYGVSFQYPVEWRLDNSLLFYLGTQILLNPESSEGPDKARAIVGFERKMNAQGDFPDGTNLNGVEFVYLVLPHSDAGHCYARLGDGRTESRIVIHGLTYRRVQGGDAGMNHGATRDIYGAFENGRCYLFEGDIYTANGENPKPLTGAQLRKLQNEIAAVMQSVKISDKQ